MRAAFLLPTLSPSGGTGVVLQHVVALRAQHGLDAMVVVPDVELPDATELPVIGIHEAAKMSWDLSIATWWTTAAPALTLPARRRLILVQGEDERAYRAEEPFDRLLAAAALHIADGVLTVSEHLAEAVAARRPGVWVATLPIGVDKSAYTGVERVPRGADDALRILVEGAPSLPGKGVRDAVRAARGAAVDVRITLATLDATGADGLDVDTITHREDARAMADLYACHDVLLKLSRAEGLGLPPIEAAHVGTPSVITPYGGQRGWMRHGENGVLVGLDDDRAVADWLTRFAADDALLQRLGRGALDLAAGWPDVAAATQAWAAELGRAVQEVPESRPGIAHAGRLVGGQLALGRLEFAALRGEHEWQQEAIASLRADVAALEDDIRARHEQYARTIAARDAKIAELNALIGELFDSRAEVHAQLQEVVQSRAYRTAVAARRLLQRPGRGDQTS